MPPPRVLLRHPGVYVHLLLSKLHWSPREKAIRRMLEQFCLRTDRPRYRIVDIGCGSGLLAQTARDLGFVYLGIDNNPGRIEYCRETYGDVPRVTFLAENCVSGSFEIGERDIVILNGAAHHLSDAQMKSLLPKISLCAGMIIADHLKVNQGRRLRAFLPSVLQYLDFGDFVRPFRYFESLCGFTLRDSDIFLIDLGSITLWTYFCNLYSPAAGRRETHENS
jgi:SAM-dependent methyltransferase